MKKTRLLSILFAAVLALMFTLVSCDFDNDKAPDIVLTEAKQPAKAVKVYNTAIKNCASKKSYTMKMSMKMTDNSTKVKMKMTST